jgi:hypothetical protein
MTSIRNRNQTKNSRDARSVRKETVMKNFNLRSLMLGFAFASLGVALAVTIPNTFSASEVISSSKMNANFAAMKTTVDTLEAKVATLEAKKSLSGLEGYYAYALVLGAAGVTNPNATFPFNPAGAITVASPAIGLFTVTFAGTHPDIRTVQVTQYQGGATSFGNCQVISWGTTSVVVRCYNGAGQLVDASFIISVAS